jgi:ribosome biogenesis GTPase
MAKKKKVRVDLRKNRSKPPRQRQWTRDFQDHGFTEEATSGQERVRPKGELSRRRTIIQEETGPAAASGQEPAEMPTVDATTCLPGRVLRVHGLHSIVETEDGRQYRCVVRCDDVSARPRAARAWFAQHRRDRGWPAISLCGAPPFAHPGHA